MMPKWEDEAFPVLMLDQIKVATAMNYLTTSYKFF